MTKDQLAAELRKQGYGRIADMLDAEVGFDGPWLPRPDPRLVEAKAAPKKKAA
jgi:hypothetical protein